MRILVPVILLVSHLLQGNSDEVLLSSDSTNDGQQSGPDGKVKPECQIRLPHKANKECRYLRIQELESQKKIFQLAIRPGLGLPLVNMTIQQLVGYLVNDPFAREETGLYTNMLKTNKQSSQQWLYQHSQEITEFSEYEVMVRTYKSWLGGKPNPYYKFVTKEEPFRDVFKNWKSDKMFAEQRLSGANPMVLRRVTTDTASVGLKWSELRPTLNPNFDWESAIQKAMGNDKDLDEAISDGHVYVLRYEVFDDMISAPDVMDDRPGRSMWQTKSPIALFAVRSADSNNIGESQLRPAVIQIDYKPDSPVFTPDDGGCWTLAKMVVQATDYAHSQMIEHLLKVHILAEPFCVVLQRQLSSQHPLNVLLKYHCRGVLTTNTIGSPSLITPGQYMDKLTAMGYKGTILLVERGYKAMSWKDTDFYSDIKTREFHVKFLFGLGVKFNEEFAPQNRGLDNKDMLPYYPYRDDCELLLQVIRRMVEDYVFCYYLSNRAVRIDSELQAFVNELSAEGTGPDGGRGQIKHFPATLETRLEVVEMVTRLIWLMSVKHAVINYPVGDYGAFTPATPTKVYNDTRVPPGTFSMFNLPNVNVSTAQAEVAMNVATFHYDSLFDYYREISDKPAARIVRFYNHYLRYATTPLLKLRNRWRYRKGHLTYPYLQYPWVPNSIQT